MAIRRGPAAPSAVLPVSGPGGPAGPTTAAGLTDVVAALKAVVTAPDLASARLALGLAPGSNVQAWDADLDAIAALATTPFGRALLTLADAPGARTALGLGSLSVQDPAAVAITGGAISGASLTGALTGNATTASALSSPRILSLTGDATGSLAFDGSANAAAAVTLSPSGATAGSYGAAAAVPVLTFDAKGRATATGSTAIAIPSAAITDAGSANAASTVVRRDASGNFAAGTVTAALAGNAATASALQTARALSLSGDATGTIAFDGSAAVAIPVTLAGTGVAAGAYVLPSVTFDAKGRATAASQGALTGDVSTTAGSLATTIAAGAVTNGKLAQAPAGTLKANLLGATGAVTDQTLSAILDALVGSTRGTLAVRGASGWSALGASGYALQSNGSDLVYAASVPGTGALRFDIDQSGSLADADRDRLRRNIGGATPSAPSSSATLAVADIERDLYPTGSPTLTMPNGGAGWRSGVILNDNALTGIVTLAVPSGATLDGVTNGSTLLYPFQRVRIRQTGASTYRTDWVDRSPIVAQGTIGTGVATADIGLPAGYSRFYVEVVGLVLSTTADFGIRFGAAGAGSTKAGANDYYAIRGAFNAAGANAANQYPGTYGVLIANAQANGFGFSTAFTATPGSASLKPTVRGDVSHFADSTPNRSVTIQGVDYAGTTSGAIGRANVMQFVASQGTATLSYIVWGRG